MGLRGLDVCTGCGPGAMKGPMKGATIGHAKQRIEHGRYIGVTEPGIIAAEPPLNPIVNHQLRHPAPISRSGSKPSHAWRTASSCFPEARVRPKRSCTFHRHAPRPRQQGTAVSPSCSQAPRKAPPISTTSRVFIQARRWGTEATRRFTVIIDDPAEVARHMVRHMAVVREFRRRHNDSYNFNWLLSRSEPDFQRPFEVTHESMRALELSRAQPPHQLAANLRRAFSGIVTGNVKEYGIQAIEKYGPYEIAGDPAES